MEFFCKTDVGIKRDNNQDFFLAEKLDENADLIVVCDGMGGAAGGQIASSLAAEVFADYVKSEYKSGKMLCSVLEEALERANEAVCKKAEENISLSGMGTTVVAAICTDECYTCIWVGDSRIYAINKDGICLLSHDHSYVQSLIDNGSITEAEAKNHPNRNIITRAVGTDANVPGDVISVRNDEMLGLLLCTDGLCGYVDEKDIADICKKYDSPEDAVCALVDKANGNGGIDNVTVAIHRK